MNQKKAKALRRAAKALAGQFPDVHNHRATYQDIVRQWVEQRVVPVKEGVLSKVGRWLRGKKAPPKTKTVEVVHKESIQTVIASGWRYIQQRLKAAVRRKEARIVGRDSVVPVEINRNELRAKLAL